VAHEFADGVQRGRRIGSPAYHNFITRACISTMHYDPATFELAFNEYQALQSVRPRKLLPETGLHKAVNGDQFYRMVWEIPGIVTLNARYEVIALHPHVILTGEVILFSSFFPPWWFNITFFSLLQKKLPEGLTNGNTWAGKFVSEVPLPATVELTGVPSLKRWEGLVVLDIKVRAVTAQQQNFSFTVVSSLE
jgi:hypothetical protein